MHKPNLKSINIEPDDWLWATWRPRIPRVRPEPRPFDQEEALADLRNLPVWRGDFCSDWSKIWSKILSPVSLSQAEAHFWFLALVESCLARRQKPEELAARLARQSFTGGLSLEQVRSAMASAHLRMTDYCLSLLLYLLPLEDIIELMMEESYGNLWKPLSIFRQQVLPYLTETQTEALRQQLRPKLEPTKWSTSAYSNPPAAFYLAAQLGMHKEVQTLVESWPDDLYCQYNFLVYHHHPQEIVFGLGNASLVESHTRRLQLYLSEPDYIRAWLAHTEYSALDWVKCSILGRTDKKLVAQLIETFALVKAPEAAPHMLELMQSLMAPEAAKWLDENPTHAIAGLIPVLGRQSDLAISAVKFLQRMRRKGYEATIRSCIESEALTIPESVRSSILKQACTELDNNTTPEWLHKALINAKTSKKFKFSWIELADLPPVTIKQHCLNSDQMTLLLLALQQSTFDRPHPLVVTTLKANCESTVLDTFVWELFERWLQVGAPSKDKWVLIAVGLLGNDASVLKLASLIRI